ncbi:GNAT family N-acetyltransferase [Methylobacterium durans]|uniref:GNAT family N-acetyltransferase n=1 Tax=Methylobacterium durans TaxID=2202825 RepID=A0A2U8WAM3_9HYPH|nr:GNAT family N-acetyltransferase [Methylobacterium durans]AWN42490.1 GNAT family N-acetyltransferase [Methylobacterium durans]
MSVLVQDWSGASLVAEGVQGAHGGMRAEVWSDLGAVEAIWRKLESGPDCLGTPYQRFDWVAAFLRKGAAAGPLRVVVLRDASGWPRLLMPLAIRRERGVRVARVVGGTHANYHLPLFASREATAIRHEDLVDLLVRVAPKAGIDLYLLTHQPRTWDGAVNPLAIGARPGANDAYGLMLGPDSEATLRRAFSADARKKLRSKEKRLIEAVGPLDYRRAETRAEMDSYLGAFFAHKAARFASLCIADPYADESIRSFLAAAADPGAGTPAIEIHALVARETGRVLATFGGAVDCGRFSGMMTAFDGAADVSRFSPGDLLLHHLVRDQAERGRRAFDLGVGKARYKSSICDETIELAEFVLPVSARGRLYGVAAGAATRLRARIKRDPRLWALAQRLRRLRPAT